MFLMNNPIKIGPEEQTWAVIAHLSGLATYLFPVAGIIAPIIIILAKTESPVISAIAKQALYLNLLVFLSAIPILIMTLTIIFIPLAWVMGAIMSFAALALPIIGAIKASDGNYFQYPLLGQRPLFRQP